jgi:formate hydrogenlyase transcriptional activator
MSIDPQRILDAAPALICGGRADGYLDYFNGRWLEEVGATVEALRGSGWTRFIHAEDLPAHLRSFQEAVSGGRTMVVESRVRRSNGDYRWMLHRLEPLRDERGEIERWLGSSVDIDEPKSAEGKLRTVLETIPAYVWTASADGSLEFITESWFEKMGHDRQEVLGWKWPNQVHADDRERVVAEWKKAVATGSPIDQEMRVPGSDGRYRWLMVRGVPLRDETGAVVRWYGTIADFEDRKRAEQELYALKDQLHRENIALRDEISQTSMFEEIVGSSAPLRRVLMLVSKVASTDSTVLITGETGTGKELIARAIHKRSPRASRPFVSVNCGAIPPSLVNSELFGHEKGAFTGAVQRHLGRFELADGGTIFLDEVGELPPETQVALLRVLQERTFERVGGGKPIPLDVRVIAATNRDLIRAMQEGSFRADLYYRLSVFPLHVPPLRERAEDVPVLVEYLAQRYASKAGKRIQSVSRRTIDLLTAYDWPGNVRELQNVIQRAVILCDGTLEVDQTWLQNEAKRANRARGLGRPSLDEEKLLIERALAGAHGRVSGPDGAAAKLGIPRSTLESKIRSLHIDKHRFRTA